MMTICSTIRLQFFKSIIPLLLRGGILFYFKKREIVLLRPGDLVLFFYQELYVLHSQ